MLSYEAKHSWIYYASSGFASTPFATQDVFHCMRRVRTERGSIPAACPSTRLVRIRGPLCRTMSCRASLAFRNTADNQSAVSSAVFGRAGALMRGAAHLTGRTGLNISVSGSLRQRHASAQGGRARRVEKFFAHSVFKRSMSSGLTRGWIPAREENANQNHRDSLLIPSAAKEIQAVPAARQYTFLVAEQVRSQDTEHLAFGLQSLSSKVAPGCMTMAGMAGENAAIQRFARCRIDEAVAHARAFCL